MRLCDNTIQVSYIGRLFFHPGNFAYGKGKKLHLELLENKKYINVLPLLFYLRCYESLNSVIVDVLIAMKGKNEKKEDSVESVGKNSPPRKSWLDI